MSRKPTASTDPHAGNATAPARKDTETLAEIARAIRAGKSRKGGGAGSELPSSPDGAERDIAAPGSGASEAQLSAAMAKLAHELNTPLSAIASASEIMKDERLGPIGGDQYRGYAADIHVSAGHALAVLARILEGLRTASAAGGCAEPPLTYAEIDLNGLVAATVSSLKPLAGSAGVGLSARLEPGLPHLVADAVSVRQILINLLTNALRATERGGTVEAQTAYTLDGPVRLVVSDTGTGMSALALAQARGTGNAAAGADVQTSGFGAGLGLGLPLVRDLVVMNGAELAFESTPKRGTTATVTFGRDRVIPV